jgi:hypothetical protein
MADPKQAVQTQLANIEKRSGKSLAELAALIRASGLSKVGEVRTLLKTELGLGHGDANAVALHVLNGPAMASIGPASADAGEADLVLDEIYSGAKAGLRPLHEAVMALVCEFGEFEIAPKKGYLSLRRKKQFAMLGPATQSKIEIGFNMKDQAAGPRLIAQAPGGMCNYKLRLGAMDEVDADLRAWLRCAFDAAA